MADSQYRLLQVNVEGDAVVLTITEKQVEGDAVAQALSREMLAAVTETGVRHVIVDFQNVHYISSVAFGPLLHVRRHLQPQSGRLVVCGLNSMVGDIFYTTKMVDPSGKFSAPFEMQPDVPAAVAAMQTAPAEQTEPAAPSRGADE
jgi:anti-anti-sigma factor